MYDCLIIGSGGAGLSAAIEAKARGAKVLLVSKTPPTWSQTCMAQGGMNAALKDADSVSDHVADTLKASGGLARESMVRKLCENAGETVKWLDSLGVPFNRTEDGEFAQRALGGASHKRACFSQDYTGLKVLHTLFDSAKGTHRRDDLFLLELLVEKGSCRGALFVHRDTLETEAIEAKTVLLATGGYTGVYKGYTTNSDFATGDGIAAAKRAGARLSHMEFVQFHPTALKSSKALISESARGEGGYLLNSDKERFVDELLPRDVVSRAIAEQLEAGREVFLDIRHLGEEFIHEFMPQEAKLAKFYEGVDPAKELIPITPAAHYSMGGIAVDDGFQSSIENLYAVGECSDSGVHGANRLGGNSLLEITAFGRMAAQSALQNAPSKAEEFSGEEEEQKRWQERIEALQKQQGRENFYALFRTLGELMFHKAGIFKEQTELEALQGELDRLETRAQKSAIGGTKALIEYLEFCNTLELAQSIARAALQREESVGAHFRKDRDG